LRPFPIAISIFIETTDEIEPVTIIVDGVITGFHGTGENIGVVVVAVFTLGTICAHSEYTITILIDAWAALATSVGAGAYVRLR
tara:strand:+ start:383 stop:634 length:252 start_codon:yes stop_codon:yes gene_type:complete